MKPKYAVMPYKRSHGWSLIQCGYVFSGIRVLLGFPLFYRDGPWGSPFILDNLGINVEIGAAPRLTERSEMDTQPMVDI